MKNMGPNKKEKHDLNDIGIKEFKSRRAEYIPVPVELPEGYQLGKYKVMKRIESDTEMNCICVVQDKKKDEYALKVERCNEKEPMLRTELFVLQQMEQAGSERKHFCKIFDRGANNDFKYIVITLTGKSLRAIRKESKDQRFSLGCALSVGIQCLKGLETLHEKGFIHRNVQPSNFCVGRAELKEHRLIYCLDFGFAHQYKTKEGKVKPKREKPYTYRGSLRHASRNCYKGEELARVDDLEMWLYMVVEFSKGSLPWMNEKNPKEVYEWQEVARKDFGIRQLFGGLPVEFVEVMSHIDGLKFVDTPDYNKIYGLLQNALCVNGLDEFPYDWEEDKPKPMAANDVKDSAENAAKAEK
ncbi:unnamed protein product, partial [Mesorhabditis belari]|uniref:Protein kinase domain-containing protein n=1 Tax=Mesorhabditis belari TaxID=2138241 RepID=A0AAF3FCJ6_9BILA